MIKNPYSIRGCAAGIAALLLSLQPLTAGDNTTSKATIEPSVADQEKWTLVPTFSFSHLTGRDSWQEYDDQLFYKIAPNLTVGGEVDVRNRPPSGTDELYSALVSYYPWKPLEIHGEVTFSPDASFSPRQIYQGGLEWRPIFHISALLDYQRFNYSTGSIDQIKPGLTYWFTDETFFTVRYAHGWAFGSKEYDGAGARINFGLPGKRRLIVGYWYGADPEKDFGVPNVISTNVNTYSLYFQQPILRSTDLLLGVEHEDRIHSYKRTTGTIGLIIKF